MSHSTRPVLSPGQEPDPATSFWRRCEAVLGIWVQAIEGEKFWAGVLAELRTRGIEESLIVCCDGLTGFREAIEGDLAAGDSCRPAPLAQKS